MRLGTALGLTKKPTDYQMIIPGDWRLQKRPRVETTGRVGFHAHHPVSKYFNVPICLSERQSIRRYTRDPWRLSE